MQYFSARWGKHSRSMFRNQLAKYYSLVCKSQIFRLHLTELIARMPYSVFHWILCTIRKIKKFFFTKQNKISKWIGQIFTNAQLCCVLNVLNDRFEYYDKSTSVNMCVCQNLQNLKCVDTVHFYDTTNLSTIISTQNKFLFCAYKFENVLCFVRFQHLSCVRIVRKN